MRTIYTTVGTSLLGNLNLMSKASSLGELRWNSPREGVLATRFENLKNELLNEIQSHLNNYAICAEVQSTLKAKEKYGDIEVYLICTDSVLSPVCALGIQFLLVNYNIPVKFDFNEKHIVEGLSVVDKQAAKDFESKGILNLFDIIQRNENTNIEINKKEKTYSSSVFNISGGYKAVIPVMSIISQLYRCETIYIYEKSDLLITLNNLPVSFDWIFTEKYFFYLTINAKDNFDDETIIDSTKLNPKDKIQYDELVKWGIFSFDTGKKTFTKTIIGKLVSKYLLTAHPASKSVYGLYLELIVFKYYVKYREQNQLFKVEHGVSMHENEKVISDIDIKLTKKDNKFIHCEVKSLMNFIHYDKANKKGKSLLAQIEKHIKYHIDAKSNIDEYRIIIYDRKDFTENRREELNKVMSDISDKINVWSRGLIKFSLHYFEESYNYSMRSIGKMSQNKYQDVFQFDINQKFIKPINFK